MTTSDKSVLTAAMPLLVGMAGLLGGVVAAEVAEMVTGGVVALLGGDPDQELVWQLILLPVFALAA